LVITGSEPDVCVLATVLGEAVDLGYAVTVATVAICSFSDEEYDAFVVLGLARANPTWPYRVRRYV
jgi:nicotinamidase-related amidase